jgi:enolase-phosphatase E1
VSGDLPPTPSTRGARSGQAGVRAVLLDIEGVTTPVAFVSDVLFPHARRHLRRFVEQHATSPEYEALFNRLRDERAAEQRAGEEVPAWMDAPLSERLASIVRFLEWQMDRDRKSTALKELQGRIWEDGYARGELAGEVFPDVPAALERWRSQRVPVGIFSSGSVLAQQLLFRHSSAGDLSGFLKWHFDTTVGAKTEVESYRRIASEMGMAPGAVLFVSDVVAELAAARAAGMHTVVSIRPGNKPLPPHEFPAIRSLDDLAREGSIR